MVSQRDIFNEINADDVTSNEYLQMANHCKELLETKDNEIIKLKKTNLELKKVICVSYGLSRTADLITDNFISSDNSLLKQITDLIHEVRNVTSNYLFGSEEMEDELAEVLFNLEV